MDFRTWVENLEDNEQQATRFPASAEVLRTGLQPQVDAEEINTSQKQEHDQLLAIDAHIERLKSATSQINAKDSQKLKAVKQLLTKFLSDWDLVKTNRPATAKPDGFRNPSDDELDFMKRNQPLPTQTP